MTIWEKWIGQQAIRDDGATYIATTEEQWHTRLKIWQVEYKKDPATKCPCPMPEGHMIFEGNSGYYRLISDNPKPKQDSLPFGELSNGNPIRTKRCMEIENGKA